MAKRGTFGSRFGTIVAVGGSVIGLGNVWRFPYLAGENGGAAFMLIYISISLAISIPIMLSEFSIGRASKRNALRSFKKLSPNRIWMSAGYLGIATAFIILSFYSVIAGWAMEFFSLSVGGDFMESSPAEVNEIFSAFIASGWRPVLQAVVFVAGTAAIVGAGVQKGIERYNKILMPTMLVILVIMAVNSTFLPGWREGMTFLFSPDFSKISWRVALEALGQSFFSMSIGMGAMITYGSYIKKQENMFKVAGTVAVSDLCIAAISGIAIFPAVFSFGISPTSGPDLVFLTLPNIFAQMTGGYILSILFFFMLFAAAITSAVSLLEVVVAYISEEFQMRRPLAAAIAGVGASLLSALCAISQMPGSTLRIGGNNFFDFFDKAASNVMMPVGAIIILLFVGRAMDKTMFRNELTSGGQFGVKFLYPAIKFMVKFIIPLFVALLLLARLGLVR